MGCGHRVNLSEDYFSDESVFGTLLLLILRFVIVKELRSVWLRSMLSIDSSSGVIDVLMRVSFVKMFNWYIGFVYIEPGFMLS